MGLGKKMKKKGKRGKGSGKEKGARREKREKGMIKYEILSHIQRETFIPMNMTSDFYMILLMYCINNLFLDYTGFDWYAESHNPWDNTNTKSKNSWDSTSYFNLEEIGPQCTHN